MISRTPSFSVTAGLLMLFFTLAIRVEVAAQDVRMIGGVAVDLRPVHEWLTARHGERPMKHWKVLHVEAYKKTISGWEQFMVKLEDGLTIEMLIDHLEPSIKAPFANLNQILVSLTTVRVQLRNDEQQFAGWANQNALAVQRQRAALSRQIAEERRELARLEASHRTAEAQGSQA